MSDTLMGAPTRGRDAPELAVMGFPSVAIHQSRTITDRSRIRIPPRHAVSAPTDLFAPWRAGPDERLDRVGQGARCEGEVANHPRNLQYRTGIANQVVRRRERFDAALLVGHLGAEDFVFERIDYGAHDRERDAAGGRLAGDSRAFHVDGDRAAML